MVNGINDPTNCNSPTQPPPDFMGILFSGASGAVTNTQVVNIAGSSLDNCGEAIWVQSTASAGSVVSISGNTVTGYTKNGISCNDEGTICTIDKNKVSPLSTAGAGVATNGILIADGAKGTVSGNTVTENLCTYFPACGSNLYNGEATATGIGTYWSGGATVTGNKLQQDDIGVSSYDDTAPVTATSNTIQDSTYEGILQYDGNYIASKNQISSSPIGVAVVSDGFILTATYSTLNGNDFNGHFSTAIVQVIALSGGTYGGPNNPTPAVVLTINGLSQTVSGVSPYLTTVDITSL